MEEEAELLYWQAVQDSLAGEHAAAHRKLRALGCRYALAPAVWDACLPPYSSDGSGGTGSGPRAEGSRQALFAPPAAAAAGDAGAGLTAAWTLDDSLPPGLLVRLQRAFAPGAAYWREHGYFYPDTPFFSHVFELPAADQDSGGAAAPAAAVARACEDEGGAKGGGHPQGSAADAPGRPANALEAAAVLILRRCRRGDQGAEGAEGAPGRPASLLAGATHVEFWAHTRPLDAPHQLHFDVNEGFLRRGPAAYHLVHPSCSSLLFITGVGGPTIVLNQTPAGSCDRDAQEPPAVAPIIGAAMQEKAAREAAGAEEGEEEGEAGRSLKRQRVLSEDGAAAGGAGPAAAVGRPLDAAALRHLATRAWLLQPSAGRWAAWEGSLLHGVLPGALQQEEEEDDGGEGEGQGGYGGMIGGDEAGGGRGAAGEQRAGEGEVEGDEDEGESGDYSMEQEGEGSNGGGTPAAGGGQQQGAAPAPSSGAAARAAPAAAPGAAAATPVGAATAAAPGGVAARPRLPPDPCRTTLVLAWWRGDPRDTLRSLEGDSAGGGADEGGAGGAPAETPSGAGPEGGSSQVPGWPRPMMTVPVARPPAAMTSGGGGAGPAAAAAAAAEVAAPLAAPAGGGAWADDLFMEEGEWEALEAEAAAAAGSGTAHAIEAAAGQVSPCWVAVDAAPEGEGEGKGEGEGEGGGLAQARLPPLRFFLPSADAVEAAYPIA